MSDFDRHTWCLLGLPFDVVDMQGAIEAVQRSATDRSPCFISTPNLNFLIASQSDPGFRDSVVNSELSLADGMPLVWAARLMGVPLPGRVTGSGLIGRLRKIAADYAISVFFFGGKPGIARRACETINEEQGGLKCAGFYDPGFGSVDEMTSPAIIDTINASGADFLIVSLGARKGQAWIERNRKSLSAPVISHLGAVVNFVAGNVRRAPVGMQKTGLEWVWRIVQEPELWRRYFTDGIRFLSLITIRLLPYAIWRSFKQGRLNDNRLVKYDVEHLPDLTVISLDGNCVVQSIAPLREIFKLELEKSVSMRLDLSAVPVVDGAFLGLCLVLRKHLGKKGLVLEFVGLNKLVRRLFHWNCVDYLL